MYEGFALADHVVPEGAVVVCCKVCEVCGCMMFVANRERYCLDCVPPPLEFFGYSLGSILEKALAQ